MSLRQIQVHLTKELYEELHNLMGMKLKDPEGDIQYETYSGVSFQQWYREVIKAGLKQKKEEFVRERDKLEAEHH
jgi:hypothetical protein